MAGITGDNKNQVNLNVSTRTIIRVLVLIFVWFVALTAVHKATHALILLFTGFFLSLALNAPVHWLAQHLPGKRRGSRALATGLSFIVVILILAAFLASVVPPLVRQSNTFIQSAPRLVADLHNQNSSMGHFVQSHHLQGEVDKLSHQFSDRLKNITDSAFSTIGSITSSVFSILTVLVITFMMLVEGPRWLSMVERLLPEDKKAHLERIGRQMYHVIRSYVNGQVILATIAAVLILLPLLIFHISYPVALVMVVFICGLIPLVGHGIGALIVSLVALFHSPIEALIILIYYILYIQIENYIIQPKLQANSTNMTPLLVFVSLLIGVSFDGLFGGLVAIPVAGCLKVLVTDYLNHHQDLGLEEVIVDTK